jgi:hypothetical protein
MFILTHDTFLLDIGGAPTVPVVDFKVDAHPWPSPVWVGLTDVVLSESVDVAKALVVYHRYDTTLHTHMGRPVILGKRGNWDAGVSTQMIKAHSCGVETKQDSAIGFE